MFIGSWGKGIEFALHSFPQKKFSFGWRPSELEPENCIICAATWNEEKDKYKKQAQQPEKGWPPKKQANDWRYQTETLDSFR